jgi:predicted nucleic acid-binding protein
MSLGNLEGALPPGDRILLDTTALASYFDAGEATHPVARHVVEELVGTGRNAAIVSMVTAMELLVRPLRVSPAGQHTVLTFLRHHPNLTAVSLDLEMAQSAAMLRALHRFKPPDALVIGTGLACRVGHLVTNDFEWAKRLDSSAGGIRVCTLADHLPFP